MTKAKKDGKYLHCYIKANIMSELNEFVEKTGYSKTVAVEKAIKMFLDSQKEEKNR